MLEAQPGQSLVEGLFGPAESIHQRFAGLDGVLLQEQAWAVKGSTYQMLTWGHLTEAVLLANSRSPVNPFVQATVARGLEHVTVFHDSMPDDVASYLVRLHNHYHGGAPP